MTKRTAQLLTLCCAAGLAQAPPPAGQAQSGESVPLYRITVVGRTAKAVNYLHRSGPTKIGFRGTVLLHEAGGEATVESRR